MYVKYLIGSLFSLFLLLGGLWPGQSDFFAILLCLVPANICYFILMGFSKRDDSILFYMLLAIALRVGMLFTSPHLSDDYVRFIWDGHLSNNTKNPYEKKPVDQISSIESNRYIYLYSLSIARIITRYIRHFYKQFLSFQSGLEKTTWIGRYFS